MENLLGIAVAAIFINNIVLTKFLGLCPFFGLSTRLKTSVMMGMAVTFVATCSSLITWLVYQYLLVPFHIEYMRIVAFILVIASFVQLVEITIRKLSPPLYRAFGIYLPLITVNCAILGVTLINVDVERYSFAASVVNGFATGLGYTLAILMMAGMRERLEICEAPSSFRGLPLAFITAALLALAFQGFGGMVE
jgi:electron transport complex protein RnfA